MNKWLQEVAEEDLATAVTAFETSPSPLIAAMRERCGGDSRFGIWMMLADRDLRRRTGLGVVDLADWDWRAAYDLDQAPATAARDALAADRHFAVLGVAAEELRTTERSRGAEL